LVINQIEILTSKIDYLDTQIITVERCSPPFDKSTNQLELKEKMQTTELDRMRALKERDELRKLPEIISWEMERREKERREKEVSRTKPYIMVSSPRRGRSFRPIKSSF
jgi:hypothetical protein